MLTPVFSALAALAGVLLDRLFGAPRRFHPLIGFGRLATERDGRRLTTALKEIA